MFGTFNEKALAQYEELVLADYREKKVKKATQGSEWADTAGLGPNDSSFIDAEESQDASDYSETYDFARCVRADGTLYGIADGKKCRKGTETKAEVKAPTAKQKRREGIRKRGETALKRATAEKVLEDLRKEGKKESEVKAKAEQRRQKKDPLTNRDRTSQIQGLVGKATKALDRLKERRRRVTKDTDYSRKLDARIKRLQGAIDKLQNEKYRLQKLNPPKGEGFGRISPAYETGRGLA